MPRPHAALACRGSASLRRDRRVRPAAGDGLLARAHPFRDLLLPSPGHRRHHQRELRRRVDRPHHRAVWLRNRERLDDPRRPQGDASTRARHAGGKAGGLHARRPARPGASRAAWCRVAGRAHGQPATAVSPGGLVVLERAQLGQDADPEAVQHRRTRGWRADRGGEGNEGRCARSRAS